MESKLLTCDRFVDPVTGFTYRYILSDTEYFRPHYHDYCEIFIMLHGQAQHMVNNQLIPLNPRDMVFIRPSDTHDYASQDGNTFSMLNIAFSTDTLQEIFSFLGAGFPSQSLMETPLPPSVPLTKGELEALSSRMAAVGAIPAQNTTAIRTALRILVFDLISGYFSEFSPGTHTTPLWLETLCAEMRRNNNFIKGSNVMFSLTDKSREHVCRSMKKYMGTTVSEFINDLRLNYVCNMLINSNHSITDILFESGFNNLSWASELFKKKYAMTMRQFRAIHNK